MRRGDGSVPDDGLPLRQLLAFRVHDGLFALPLETVTEVMRMVAVTAVPDCPVWLAGVINLRGSVVPIVDLRSRLGLEIRAARLTSRIIVVDVSGQAVGLVVDSTTEVVSVPQESVTRPDELTGQARPVEAIARHGDQLVPILDLRRIASGLERFGAAEIQREEHGERVTC